LAARAVLAQALPGETLHGYVAQAGLPKGFAPASGQRAA
jgi:hydroxymethylglutaryl-CoA lyase